VINFEKFEALFEEELNRIPERFKRGINSFAVEKRAVRQPGANLSLYILGHYFSNFRYTGPAVVLYYGSFSKVFRGMSEKRIRKEIAKTLAHEILHHWENQSGIDDLGEEDRRKLQHWKMRYGIASGEATGRDFLEALIFLFIVFSSLTVASSILGYFQ